MSKMCYGPESKPQASLRPSFPSKTWTSGEYTALWGHHRYTHGSLGSPQIPKKGIGDASWPSLKPNLNNYPICPSFLPISHLIADWPQSGHPSVNTKYMCCFFPQDVWRGRATIREKEVDPLLWGSHLHHFLCGPQCLWYGASGRWRSGKWPLQ